MLWAKSVLMQKRRNPGWSSAIKTFTLSNPTSDLVGETSFFQFGEMSSVSRKILFCFTGQQHCRGGNTLLFLKRDTTTKKKRRDSVFRARLSVPGAVPVCSRRCFIFSLHFTNNPEFNFDILQGLKNTRRQKKQSRSLSQPPGEHNFPRRVFTLATGSNPFCCTGSESQYKATMAEIKW